jgi:hypothetical protein
MNENGAEPMERSKRSEIVNLLRSQLDKAHAVYIAASTRQGGVDSRAALRTYSAALQRFANFTESGIVPEDLLSSPDANEFL